MNLIKKIFTSPYLHKFVFSYNWTLIFLIIAVLLYCLLVFLVVKRKRQEKAKEPEIIKEEEDFLPPASLFKIWKTFLKNIPHRFRRSILMYQPYIVMGEAGTGKTCLIDNYTDWQNQANQFYPSHTQDELLQVYLGTRIIVQEISSSLLHDTSSHARKALKNLWKIFKRKKDLVTVVTLKGDDLVHGDPDFLREQAQIMRGKVNILSEILKHPVKIRIALTFMNHVKGFSEFSAFLHANNLPLELKIDKLSDLDNLENAIKSYEQYFSNALVSEKPENYLKILSFCQTAPSILLSLSDFIKILAAPDPLSSSPIINSVFFTSDIVNENNLLSNPFTSQIPIKKVRTYNPMRKHKIAAILIAGIGITYMLFSYYYRYNYISEVKGELDRINYSITDNNGKYKNFTVSGKQQNQNYNSGENVLYPVFVNNNEISGKIGKPDHIFYINRAKLLNKLDRNYAASLNNMLLIDFFPNAKKQIHRKIINTKNNLKKEIINKIFRQGLIPVDIQKNAFHKNLLILSLIYGSRTNTLGRLVNKNISLWAESCNIDKSIIRAYLSLSDQSWNKAIQVNKFIDNKLSANTGQYVSWLIFLKNLGKIAHDSFVSPQSLSELQNYAGKIIDKINESSTEAWFYKLKRLLYSETILGKSVISNGTYQNEEYQAFNGKNYQEFKKFLFFFRNLHLDHPVVKDLNLAQLLENLRIMMKIKNPETKVFDFTVNRQKFYFSSDTFYHLMNTSSMVMLLRDYVSYYSRFPGMSFFNQNAEYKDLVLYTSSEDAFFFSKKAVIDGRYTKKIYNREVMPVLKALPDLLKKLPVSETEKTHFANFMFREVNAYIGNYIANYEKYYRKFTISADSVGELRYILTQMTLPINQFQEFLMTLNNNLSLDCPDNPYFNLIKARLKPLRFISLLMQAQKDEFPELEQYKAILRQMLGDLVSKNTGYMNDNNDKTGILKSKLPVIARISLDIFLNGPGSYLRMVEKWGTSVGIPEQWLYPFTEPIYQAYLLGQKKIAKTIKKEWNTLETYYIRPVIDKFPFNPEATSYVSPDDLKNLVCPSGKFWKKFSGEIAPLCRKTPDGKWHERSFVMSSLKFPKNMLKELNYISRLSGIFFDAKANPIPLVFEIKPHTLPLIQDKLILVVLSYVRTGKTSVFGFNQQPAWQKFPIEWWKPNTSSAGIQFMQRGKNAKKMFANITVQNSYWSFYRLLKKADTPEPKTWMWDIMSPGDIKWKRAISFSIKNNPWHIFRKDLLNGK